MNFKNLIKKQTKFLNDKFNHEKLTARDAMIKPIFLKEDDKIDLIIKKLKDEDHNYCVVVDDDYHFLGEIRIENLIKLIAHTSLNEPLVKVFDFGFKKSIIYTTSKDHMFKHKNFILENKPILNVLKLIEKKKSDYIPVLNEDKQVIGIITPSSLLNLLNKY